MRREDGVARVVEVLPDGTERLFPDTPMRPMGEAELAAAAARDPDARPFTPEELAKAKRIPRAKTLRRALGLTQEEFAARYRIPLGTLRDWEQGRSEPDQTARAYLTVIAHNPEGVRRALEAKPGQTMPAPKVAEGEAFAPDIEERHPQEIRGFDWLLLVRRLSGGESDKMPSGNSSMKSAGSMSPRMTANII
jgi:putative transcriptional regulator